MSLISLMVERIIIQWQANPTSTTDARDQPPDNRRPSSVDDSADDHLPNASPSGTSLHPTANAWGPPPQVKNLHERATHQYTRLKVINHFQAPLILAHNHHYHRDHAQPSPDWAITTSYA